LGSDQQQPLTAKQRLARREALKDQLFTAVRKGDIRALEEALEAGVPVNLMEPTNKDTPLMIACRLGHSEMVCACFCLISPYHA
jgi:ankyrin repeat protein